MRVMQRRRRRTPEEAWLAEKLEKDWQSEILRAARALGWTWYHTQRSDRSPEGFPDLVLVKPPRIVFAELKRQEGKLSTDQLVWYGLLIQCPGVEAYVWRPGDIDEVLRVLQRRNS